MIEGRRELVYTTSDIADMALCDIAAALKPLAMLLAPRDDIRTLLACDHQDRERHRHRLEVWHIPLLHTLIIVDHRDLEEAEEETTKFLLEVYSEEMAWDGALTIKREWLAQFAAPLPGEDEAALPSYADQAF